MSIQETSDHFSALAAGLLEGKTVRQMVLQEVTLPRSNKSVKNFQLNYVRLVGFTNNGEVANVKASYDDPLTQKPYSQVRLSIKFNKQNVLSYSKFSETPPSAQFLFLLQGLQDGNKQLSQITFRSATLYIEGENKVPNYNKEETLQPKINNFAISKFDTEGKVLGSGYWKDPETHIKHFVTVYANLNEDNVLSSGTFVQKPTPKPQNFWQRVTHSLGL